LKNEIEGKSNVTLYFIIRDSEVKLSSKIMRKPKISMSQKLKPVTDQPVDIFDFKSIGTITSVFREKFGTP